MSEKQNDQLAEMREIHRKVDTIYKCLYRGNGEPSLMTRVALLEELVVKSGSNWKFLVRTLLSDVLLVVVMWFLMR